MPFDFPKRLFPLHLSDIEKFLLTDDRPKYPMAFVIELHFSGLLDVGLLRQAMIDALARHPLLISKLGPAKNRRFCWLMPDGELPPIDEGPLDAPLHCPGGEWIDLENHVGLRMWLRQGRDDEGNERSILTCQFHHVCCDGIGSYRFLGDLLAYYDVRYRQQQAGSESPDTSGIPNIDLQRLRGRADSCRLKMKSMSNKEITRESIRYAKEVLGKPGTPLRRPRKPMGKIPPPFPGLACEHFSQAEAKQLRDVAKELGLMLNDLLLLELFDSCREWNAEQGRAKEKDRFRIMMPVDLRSQEDFETPACNVVGYTFLTRSTAELRDRTKVAASIREETAGIKHNRSGERFVEMTAAGATIRGLVPLATRLPLTLCTVVLSNVGDPSRRFLGKFQREQGRVVAGNVVLQHITGFPPMRPRSRATVSVVQYRRELSIGVRCDPHSFSQEDTNRLLEILVAKLRSHLD